MDITLFVNRPVTSSLRDDNFRGELRWERQVFEALLLSDKIKSVGSLYPVWKTPIPKPDKLIDGVSNTEETVGMFYYSYNIAKVHKFKGVLFNFHIGPTVDWAEYEHLRNIYGNKLILTYDCCTSNNPQHKAVGKDYGEENVENLPAPAVPEIHYCNNFDKNTILVYVKGIYGSLRYSGMYWGDLFPWLADKLKEDPNKDIIIITGYCSVDMDFCGIKSLSDEFWLYEQTSCLMPFKDRIKFLGSVGWGDILQLVSNAKIVVSAVGTGGMPMEAASYGVPMVGSPGSAISYAPESFISNGILTPEYFELLNRLFYERDIYTKVGESCRDFVGKFYTYKAFVNRLEEILLKRGLV